MWAEPIPASLAAPAQMEDEASEDKDGANGPHAQRIQALYEGFASLVVTIRPCCGWRTGPRRRHGARSQNISESRPMRPKSVDAALESGSRRS